LRTTPPISVVTSPVTTEMARVRQRKREMVEREIAFHLEKHKSTGAELIMGSRRASSRQKRAKEKAP
jgi:hypothetical protein